MYLLVKNTDAKKLEVCKVLVLNIRFIKLCKQSFNYFDVYNNADKV